MFKWIVFIYLFIGCINALYVFYKMIYRKSENINKVLDEYNNSMVIIIPATIAMIFVWPLSVNIKKKGEKK